MPLDPDDPRISKAIKSASARLGVLPADQQNQVMRTLLSFNALEKPAATIKAIIESVAPSYGSGASKKKKRKRSVRKPKIGKSGQSGSGVLASPLGRMTGVAGGVDGNARAGISYRGKRK